MSGTPTLKWIMSASLGGGPAEGYRVGATNGHFPGGSSHQKLAVLPGKNKGADYAAKRGYGESSPDSDVLILILIRQPCLCQGQQLAVAIHHPYCVLTGCCQPRAPGVRRFQRVTDPRRQRGAQPLRRVRLGNTTDHLLRLRSYARQYNQKTCSFAPYSLSVQRSAMRFCLLMDRLTLCVTGDAQP